ncbi:hypothetical protein PVAND_015246 [Polypedilum vanderplanki]|uniref:Uncharacterized protein n=1 Tax=Polypedilum vanderplanki TaxID=319348 RepID=A0A9J6BC30_POLVA|nr:hypothetical protein PVAND_015246 [Polypedilum vanderplanki]
MYYVDEYGESRTTRTNYQVLTCRTKRNETKIPLPKVPNPPSSTINTAPSCVHNWQPYINNNGPKQNGVSAGLSECEILLMKTIAAIAAFPGIDGIQTSFYDFEILVCDPWPKYKCAQQWKKLNANISVDGFSVDSTSFIGRGIRKCINGCDYGLGKTQSGSNGVNYLDDLTATAVYDNSSNVEYLVKNPSDTYKWQPSRIGVKVVNALELHKEGHRPFYIGMTRINDNVVVGKVRPGDGLFFIDPVTGKQQSTSSYEILTCTSPDASNGEYEEEMMLIGLDLLDVQLENNGVSSNGVVFVVTNSEVSLQPVELNGMKKRAHMFKYYKILIFLNFIVLLVQNRVKNCKKYFKFHI